MNILVTGSAGFIGFHLVRALLKKGYSVIGLDSINDYYDVSVKEDRLRETGIRVEDIRYGEAITSDTEQGYTFIQGHLENRDLIESIFQTYKPDRVCNLAAQAGVRYSLVNPHAYVDSNITGFINILEACRHHKVSHLVYASSSSVYGLNERMPLDVSDNVDHPVSLYAASKKSNELMAHAYSHLFGLPTTGLRFFTVYGPWGRPDMALFLFTRAILEDRPIDVFNYGNMVRDFTYVADIVRGVELIIDSTPAPDPEWNGMNPNPGTSPAPYRLYNIGNGSPVQLTTFIDAIEEKLGKKAIRNLMEMQPGDVRATHADISALEKDFGYRPTTPVKDGIDAFIQWYRSYYQQ